ncbi:MAG: hypothetical protein VX974_06275 [Pseudomonadota bacterium]|nr:hypothetical protein [Pseudomonadota bacterium]
MDISSAGSAMAGQIPSVSKQDDQQMEAPRKTPAERAADMISLSPAARAKLAAAAENNF